MMLYINWCHDQYTKYPNQKVINTPPGISGGYIITSTHYLFYYLDITDTKIDIDSKFHNIRDTRPKSPIDSIYKGLCLHRAPWQHSLSNDAVCLF